MSSKVQLMIDRGIFREDSDGKLWLSAKAKKAIALIEEDEALMAVIKEKATDEEDLLLGFLTFVFIACCPEAPPEEIDDGVHALVGWNKAARENRLKDWSMGLRLR